MPDRWADLGDGQRRSSQERLEVEASAPEARRTVVDEPRLLGPQRLDVVEIGEEGGFLVANELGETKRADKEAIRLRLLDAGDQPVFVADLDASTRGKEGDGGWLCAGPWHGGVTLS